ncbi:MAG: HD domain-containing protein [Actinobacteria bacterium]|nr:HD domain-containing protein [Actinomycetota bacterium]
MKLLKNIIIQYTVITFLVILFISITLGIILSQRITNYTIQTHIDTFPQVIQSIVKDHPQVYTFLKSPAGTIVPEDVKVFLNDLFSFGAIFRIKVWGKDGTILWSDKTELIGLNYKDNINFNEAIQGKLDYEVSLPEKTEQVTEKGQGTILEIYTPVKKNEEIVGVIELYESNDNLYLQISKNIQIVWILVSLAGVILYILLFIIFYKAYGRQRKTTRQLDQTQDVTILALAYQAELRDIETGNHIERTSHYVEILAKELKKYPKYKSYLSDRYIADLVKSAPLHDIGKVGVPDAVLRKPGKLEPDEFDKIKRHCEYGEMILKKAAQKLTFQSFLTIAFQIVMYHHEKWDGKGYPHRLIGDDIPISARIMALSDVYDALRSKRPYKNAYSHEKSVEIICKEKGKHFDPLIVEVFLKKEKDFYNISEQIADKVAYL